METIERWATNNIAYLTPSGPWTFKEEWNLFKDFIYMNTFRHQLRVFLAAYKLPTDITSVDMQWYRFLQEYAGVIEDGTLSAKSKTKQLSAVQVVTFTRGSELPPENHVPFAMQWMIQLEDGRSLKVEVKTVPGGVSHKERMMLRSIGPIEITIILLVGILPVIAFWKIFAKAGYPGALGLLLLVPLVNLVMFFFLAFSQWPVLRELETLRRKSPPSI